APGDSRPFPTRRSSDLAWRFGEPVDRLVASHTGYDRLASPVRVERVFGVARDRAVVAIADTATGAARHRLTWRFHLDPAIAPRRSEEHTSELQSRSDLV